MGERQYPPEPERTKPAYYASMYVALLETAQYHGYTLACHGSMVRDFDLIAVPWTDKATSAEQLIQDMAFIHGDDRYRTAKEVGEAALKTATKKPHGRVAYQIVMGVCRLDISVMPRVEQGESHSDCTATTAGVSPTTEAEA